MYLTLKHFNRLAEFLYKRTGLRFEERKFYFIKRRLENLLELKSIQTFEEFFNHLSFYDADGSLLQELTNAVTTNETYFFREFEQLQIFAEILLPEVLEKKQKSKDNYLNIWCAACSTGEEAYTLTIILLEMLDYIDDWKIKILASDIDSKVLEHARLGEYCERSVKPIPKEYFDKYIYKNEKSYSVVPHLKKYIIFDKINFMDKEAMRRQNHFDFIFCRNALIYFDDIGRKQICHSFYKSLNNGGYILLGHSESMSRITPIFKMAKKGSQIVYYK